MEPPPNRSYGIGLLDDLHTHFPDVLYNTGRFHTIGDLLDYVYEVAVDSNEEHFLNSMNAYHRDRAAGRVGGESEEEEVKEDEEEDEDDEEEEEGEEGEEGEIETDNGRIYIAVSRRRFRDADEEHPDGISVTQRPRLSEELLEGNGRSLETSPVPSVPPAPLRQHTGILRNILRSRIVQRTTMADPFFGLGLTATQLNMFLEPVPIVPNGYQIDAASTTYDADAADAEYTCTICQDSFQVGEHILRLNYCSHIFHTVCIHQWFTSSVRCPLCRHDIRELPEPEPESESDSIS